MKCGSMKTTKISPITVNAKVGFKSKGRPLNNRLLLGAPPCASASVRGKATAFFITMKLLSVIIITAFLAGCSLSRGSHLVVFNQDGRRSDSACGYFDNSIKFGAENEILISSEDVVISICSIDHYSKVVAKGLVIPLYPVDGYEVIKPYRWVKITNSGAESIFIADSSDKIKATFQRYPDNGAGTLEDIDNEERQIAPSEHVWVGFTDEDPLSLVLESPSQEITLKFSQDVSYSWYMATH